MSFFSTRHRNLSDLVAVLQQADSSTFVPVLLLRPIIACSATRMPNGPALVFLAELTPLVHDTLQDRRVPGQSDASGCVSNWFGCGEFHGHTAIISTVNLPLVSSCGLSHHSRVLLNVGIVSRISVLDMASRRRISLQTVETI